MNQPLERILYVEDDADIAEVTCMALSDIGGFHVRHCLSGRKALETFPFYRPQLVLMDVMMPDMDGPETFRQLRLLPQGESVPVIFITAKAQMHEQDAYRALGATGIILKPFDPMTLSAQVTKIWEENNG